MYKTGILNSDISKLLSDLGHTDEIMIADCGLPIPNGVKKIDLALDFGKPSFLDVFHIVKSHMTIEKMTLASEMKTENESLYNVLKEEEIKFTTESHELLKQHSKHVKAIIRTGEAKPYANVILASDVLF
ncbi:D-ribose pyranase [Staphylococcus saprophyticus]|uniref:D-ribose pyranase n=1 Tax=Staphylococcus saprophyticus TaxID=29385 RepID=UPI000657ACB4|nr:D-ribose pyranase [Staphylococcus saprophyticus]MDW3949594.1 D-ribose pyranase [Staphylococcus saprophyticus]MDW4145738.1 D-ribose pyranase [Staphylococcus saprophyticus]RXS16456.1 D-ribose pyranase [Staphylococcus saprophyticus]CRV20111.1 high affinity ribose transport protein RbsD [Streptococcus equi subsp. equi]